uniref:Uncharacterized protein n=1 Tax=Schizophyllum commune (strain H4-8 / FGSC 9210) TaxID=578458 RepID=D8Q5G4_SCHCM
MANKYQRDLFDQFLALLPSASAVLKTALREVAHCDLPAARKIVKYLKTHVEELRALDAKVVEHYEGNKEKLVAALDGVMVIMDFKQVHDKRPIMAHCLTVCYTATDSLAPGESADDFYRGLSATKRSLQEIVSKLKAEETASKDADDVVMHDADAPAVAESSKGKGKARRNRKGAAPGPSAPDASEPPAPITDSPAVAAESGSLKRSGSPTEGDRPAKMYVWDASASGFSQYGTQGLMVEGMYGANPIATALGEGASAIFDRANTLGRQSYGDGEFDLGVVVHSLAQVTAVLNASALNLGALCAAHTAMDGTRRTLSKVYRRATAREVFSKFDASDDEGVPGSRRTSRSTGSETVQKVDDEARAKRDASPATAARAEAALTNALAADSEAELDDAISEAGKAKAPQVTEGASNAAEAMEVDNVAPKKKEASRSSSRAAKKSGKPTTRSSAKETEEETPAIATLPAA